MALALGAVALGGLSGCDLNENADRERGRQLFTQECGTCHTLAEAGTGAVVGPNLDDSFARARTDGMDNDTIEGVVQGQIANPREINPGDPDYDRVFMPADLVTGQDAEDVAAYVASVAGIPGIEAPQLDPPQLFAQSCGSCHTLAAAGTNGTVGPNLDQVLPGQSAKQVNESIVDPSAQLTQGFENLMPETFGTTLTPEDLDGLIDYLLKSAGKG